VGTTSPKRLGKIAAIYRKKQKWMNKNHEKNASEFQKVTRGKRRCAKKASYGGGTQITFHNVAFAREISEVVTYQIKTATNRSEKGRVTLGNLK